ncbi:hypothetical protein C2G38_2161153 [Gigaspora rosea]|uniref:Uncharacterized protein n=1 Tax=Gigaspora rosea TaxID=44941 RepID=A0A397W1T6_9GLOM|nr:hypothetical protein C2G38_2161153 [Gigaspora rosea]
MAGINNKHVNNFKLELTLYLAESGETCDAINALSSAEVSVTHQTVYNYKKKIADEHPIRMAQWNSSFSNFDRIKQLLTYFYDNTIEERKEECKMKGAILVGVKEQQLHSMQDYLNALNIVFNYNKEIGHLVDNVVPGPRNIHR